VRGRALAASITLYGFYALFALTLLAVSVIGYVSAGHQHVARDVTNWIGVKGDAATIVTDAVKGAEHGRHATGIVGLLGLLWVGSGFALAVGTTYDAAWDVPVSTVRSRAVGLLWLGGSALIIGPSVLASGSITSVAPWAVPLLVVGALLTDVAFWTWTSWVLPNRAAPWRAILRGAVVGAVGFELLKLVAGIVVPRLVAHASALYGSLGVVLAILTWLLLLGQLVVLVTLVEVVERPGRTRSDPRVGSGPAGGEGSD
jgi:membrane protein